ncbi:hypothetical protein ABPG75_005501 [Micractinium tetrahymenae]
MTEPRPLGAEHTAKTEFEISCSGMNMLVQVFVLNPTAPARVSAAAAASSLKPLAIRAWLLQVSRLAGDLARFFGPANLPADYLYTLSNIIGTDIAHGRPRPRLAGVAPDQVQEQLLVLRPAADFLAAQAAACGAASQEELGSWVRQPVWCRSMLAALALVIDPAIGAGRARHERDTDGQLLAAAAGFLASLLPALARLGAADCSSDHVGLTLTHLRLLGTLCGEAIVQAPGRPLDRALEHMGGGSGSGNGGSILASLHTLLGWVAAAAPGGPPAAAPPALGSLLWQEDGAKSLHIVLSLWASTLEMLDDFGVELPPWSGAAACTAGAGTAEAALRLAPLLPRLPVVVPGSTAVVVPAGSTRPGQHFQELKITCPPRALCVVGCLSPFSLCASLANTPHAADSAAALALFHAAQTAVKYEWAIAAAASNSSGGSGSSSGRSSAGAGAGQPQLWEPVVNVEPCPPPLHPTCLAALRAYRHRRQLGTCRRHDPDSEVHRRLDCIALCYLEALSARPVALSRSQGVQQRALVLTSIAENPGGEDLLLAGGGRGAALLAYSAAALFGDTQQEMPLACILFLIKQAADFSPGTLPALAACRSLLHELSERAVNLQALQRSPTVPHVPPAASTLEQLLRAVVAQLKAAALDGSESETTGKGSSGSGSDPQALQLSPAAAAALRQADVQALGLAELAKLAKLAAGSKPGSSEAALSVAGEPSAAGAVPLELSLRRCRALGLRSCANPRCTDLRGPSEALLRGRRCGGCGAVRYCSDACAQADWRAHRPACKALQRQQREGQPAA